MNGKSSSQIVAVVTQHNVATKMNVKSFMAVFGMLICLQAHLHSPHMQVTAPLGNKIIILLLEIKGFTDTLSINDRLALGARHWRIRVSGNNKANAQLETGALVLKWPYELA